MWDQGVPGSDSSWAWNVSIACIITHYTAVFYYSIVWYENRSMSFFLKIMLCPHPYWMEAVCLNASVKCQILSDLFILRIPESQFWSLFSKCDHSFETRNVLVPLKLKGVIVSTLFFPQDITSFPLKSVTNAMMWDSGQGRNNLQNTRKTEEWMIGADWLGTQLLSRGRYLSFSNLVRYVVWECEAANVTLSNRSLTRWTESQECWLWTLSQLICCCNSATVKPQTGSNQVSELLLNISSLQRFTLRVSTYILVAIRSPKLLGRSWLGHQPNIK